MLYNVLHIRRQQLGLSIFTCSVRLEYADAENVIKWIGMYLFTYSLLSFSLKFRNELN